MALWLIFLLYAVIGALAATGAIALTSRHLAPRTEQVAYGLLLVPIAAYSLAFAAGVGPTAAWHAELWPVIGFAALGLAGMRVTSLLALGYLGHGIWDLLHEILMHQDRLGGFTGVPLAYGVFCAVFDCMIAGYAWTRRAAWAEGWRAR